MITWDLDTVRASRDTTSGSDYVTWDLSPDRKSHNLQVLAETSWVNTSCIASN